MLTRGGVVLLAGLWFGASLQAGVVFQTEFGSAEGWVGGVLDPATAPTGSWGVVDGAWAPPDVEVLPPYRYADRQALPRWGDGQMLFDRYREEQPSYGAWVQVADPAYNAWVIDADVFLAHTAWGTFAAFLALNQAAVPSSENRLGGIGIQHIAGGARLAYVNPDGSEWSFLTGNTEPVIPFVDGEAQGIGLRLILDGATATYSAYYRLAGEGFRVLMEDVPYAQESTAAPDQALQAVYFGTAATQTVATLDRVRVQGFSTLPRLDQLMEGDFRLPVWINRDTAELWLYPLADLEEALDLEVSFQCRETGTEPAAPLPARISPEDDPLRLVLPIAGWSAPEYWVRVRLADPASPVRGSLLRLLRRQHHPEPPDPAEPLLLAGRTLLMVDDEYLAESCGNARHRLHPAELFAVTEGPLEEGRVHQRGLNLEWLTDGTLAVSLWDDNRAQNDRRYLRAVSEDLVNWEITPDPAPPEGTAAAASSVTYRGYDPAADGPVRLDQVRLFFVGYRDTHLGDIPVPARSTWPVWERTANERLLLAEEPLMVDKWTYDEGEFDTWKDTGDNFGHSWLAPDGGRLFYFRARLALRFPPFRVPYDNIPQVNRLLTVWHTDDGIHWEKGWWNMPDEEDNKAYQHYGGFHFPVEDGALRLAYIQAYDQLTQQIWTELHYSRDSLRWRRFREPLAENGPPGSWNFGMFWAGRGGWPTRDGYTYRVLQASNRAHFYDLRADPELLTAERVRLEFEPLGLAERWPYFDAVGGWEGLAESMRAASETVGIMRSRVDGWVSLRADGEARVVTRLLNPGAGLAVNARTDEGGSILIELLDADGVPLPAYSGTRAARFEGDATRHELAWDDGALRRLPAQPIRLALTLRAADLFALYGEGFAGYAFRTGFEPVEGWTTGPLQPAAAPTGSWSYAEATHAAPTVETAAPYSRADRGLTPPSGEGLVYLDRWTEGTQSHFLTFHLPDPTFPFWTFEADLLAARTTWGTGASLGVFNRLECQTVTQLAAVYVQNLNAGARLGYWTETGNGYETIWTTDSSTPAVPFTDSEGTWISLRLELDVPAATYSLYYRYGGGAEIPLVEDAGFGNEYVGSAPQTFRFSLLGTNSLAAVDQLRIMARRDPDTYVLVYGSGPGGAVQGDSFQLVPGGGTGAEVQAEPDPGAAFVAWSDGLGAIDRRETNVRAHVHVSPRFQSGGGVPIEWYARHGITRASGETWTDVDRRDPHQKGMTLREQFVAEVDPSAPAALFKLWVDSGWPPRIGFDPSSPRRLYSLQYRPHLGEGEWEDVPGQVRLPGNGGPLMGLEDPETRFYRVLVEVP